MTKLKFSDNELMYELTKIEKNELYDLQRKLADEGFGKNSDFLMKTCWNEAMKRLRQKWKK